jgi:hypothetical protein
MTWRATSTRALRSGGGTATAAERRADRMKALKQRMNRDRRSTVKRVAEWLHRWWAGAYTRSLQSSA